MVVFESEVGSLPPAAQRPAAGLRRAAAHRRGHGARHQLPHPPRRRAPAQRDGAGRDPIRGRCALHRRGDGARRAAPSASTGPSRPSPTSTAIPPTRSSTSAPTARTPSSWRRMTAAFVAGAHEGGLLTTAKHFPGHGDTASDSHLQLATISGDRARLDRVELLPFRDAIAAGVDAVMLGHIAAPALDPTGSAGHPLRIPSRASCARARVPGPRRHGRHGDGRGARGLDGRGGGARRAARAPTSSCSRPIRTWPSRRIVRAVRRGPAHRSRASTTPCAASWRRRSGSASTASAWSTPRRWQSVDRPEDVARALDVARGSITVLRNEGGVLPLHAEEPLQLLHLVLSSDARNDAIQGISRGGARRAPDSRRRPSCSGPRSRRTRRPRSWPRAPEFTHVLASASCGCSGGKGTADMAESHARLLRALQAAGRPLVVVSFGSPYLLRQFPAAPGLRERLRRRGIEPARGGRRALRRVCCEREAAGHASRTLCIRRRAPDPEARDDAARGRAPRTPGSAPDGLAESTASWRPRSRRARFPGRCSPWARTARSRTCAPFGRLTYDDGRRRRCARTRSTTWPASRRSSSPRPWP